MMSESNLKKSKKKSGMKILLVEDNPINQVIISGILLQWGVSLTSAENGLEAIELIERHSYDLVLMDVQMPKLDGISATLIIREKLKNSTPIVAMTAYVTDEEEKKCIDAGMDGFIAKPVDNKYLFDILEKYHNDNQAEVVEEKVSKTEPELIVDGIEVYDALNRLNCTSVEFSEILENFCSFYKNIGSKLNKILKSGDEHKLKKEVHSIKGAAVNVSAINLYLAAREFEDVLKQGKKEFYKKKLRIVIKKFEEVFRSSSQLKEELERVWIIS